MRGMTAITTHTDVQTLVERHISLWNEPDPDVRRALVRELWAPDGEQILHPPEDMRAAGQALGFGAPKLEIRGHEALDLRVTRAYEDFVAPGEYVFRARDDAFRLRDLVKL